MHGNGDSVQYEYDLYGATVTATGSLATINPLRYRGYYYDSETGLYYLQSRYYDPKIGRFINADGIGCLGADGTLTGYNLFAYCGNNPVTGYDPTGQWNWRTFWDVVVTAVATVSGVFTAAKTAARARVTGSSKASAKAKGVIAGVAAFGAVNNAANAFYYNHISNGESNLETSSKDKSDYVDGYVNRWDRLDYTKQQTGDSQYGFNAWRYNSEYSMHMYGWYAINPFMGLGIEKIDAYGKSAIQVHIEPHAEDTNWKTRTVTYFFGMLGL